jgi:CNT family concentrative nucleoside transporter
LERVHSLIGFFAFAALAWGLSERRREINGRTLLAGLALQFLLAVLLLKLPGSRAFFLWLNRLVEFIEMSTRAGTGFVFGYLGGAPLPFDEKSPGMSYIFAFRGLPLVLVISALSSLLFHWKILQAVVRAFSWLLRKTLGMGGVEGLGTASNVFLGMVESPLLVRPYLKGISRSEMFTIMTAGMATIAGTVMVLYASILANRIPDVMGHLLTASLISAPATVVVAKLMVPETQALSGVPLTVESKFQGTMDAITTGTVEGVKLLINIVAMLVVLVSLVHLLNLILGLLPLWPSGRPITVQGLLGLAMSPVTWLMGIPWSEAGVSGSLMGTKTVLNEFIAFVDLAQLPEGALSERSRVIMTYAMCGFANFGSLGILIGGMGAMVPERRKEIVGMGFKCIVSGTLATCMTGAVAGVLYG